MGGTGLRRPARAGHGEACLSLAKPTWGRQGRPLEVPSQVLGASPASAEQKLALPGADGRRQV